MVGVKEDVAVEKNIYYHIYKFHKVKHMQGKFSVHQLITTFGNKIQSTAYKVCGQIVLGRCIFTNEHMYLIDHVVIDKTKDKHETEDYDETEDKGKFEDGKEISDV